MPPVAEPRRYFQGKYSTRQIAEIKCYVLMVEYDTAAGCEGTLGNKQLAVGAVDCQDMDVESPETVIERIHALKRLPPQRTMITSTCGLNHLPRQIAFGKLKAMASAKRILEGRQPSTQPE